MDDVRRTAEDRTKRPKTAPIGASFESERQRSKNALVKQLDSMDGRNVRKIAAVADAPQEEKILRVAAYCRVSTDDINQAISDPGVQEKDSGQSQLEVRGHLCRR